jgi:hypothetical protein
MRIMASEEFEKELKIKIAETEGRNMKLTNDI